MPFEDVPLIDNHAHPFLLADRAAAEPFARFFTEASFPEPHTLFYRQALRELAAMFGCPADEPSVLAAREVAGYARRLVNDAHLEAVLLDDGYPVENACSISATAALGGFRAHHVLRIERALEELIPRCESLAELEQRFIDRLESAREEIVAIKSIIAYRSGLMIDPPDPRTATLEFDTLRVQWTGRLTAKPLLEYCFYAAIDWAARHRIPVQLHTGFGDRDIDLRLANPLHLRPLLERGTLGRSPLVLLHASYPYVREAGYLASVYPDVYVDLSEVSPLLVGPALSRVLEDLLGQAPVTRLLYGSDAWGIPEWLWLAARATRRALGDVLSWLPDAEASWVALRILHANAAELYHL